MKEKEKKERKKMVIRLPFDVLFLCTFAWLDLAEEEENEHAGKATAAQHHKQQPIGTIVLQQKVGTQVAFQQMKRTKEIMLVFRM